MTKETKETKETEQELELTTSKNESAALVNQSDIEKIQGNLLDLDNLTPTVALNFNYLDLKQDEPKNFLFMGFSNIMVKDEKGEEGSQKELEVIKLIDSSKSLFIMGAVAIVSDLKNSAIPMGTPIGITYIGKEKRTKKFDVRLLTN